MTENEIGESAIGRAIQLHQELRPGLQGSVAEVLFAHLISRKGISVAAQVSIPIRFHGIADVWRGGRAKRVLPNLCGSAAPRETRQRRYYGLLPTAHNLPFRSSLVTRHCAKRPPLWSPREERSFYYG